MEIYKSHLDKLDPNMAYIKTLNLARACYHLYLLEKSLAWNTDKALYRPAEVSVSVLRVFDSTLRMPEQTEAELKKELAHQNYIKQLTPEEREEFLEQESNDLRQKIQESFLDWEPKIWITREEGVKIFEACQACLQNLLPDLRPQEYLIDFLVHEYCHSSPNQRKWLRRAFLAWDFGKIQYEGEPPYKIVFSEGALADLAEILGNEFEAPGEIIKRPPSMEQRFRLQKRFLIAKRLAITYLPQYRERLSGLYYRTRPA